MKLEDVARRAKVSTATLSHVLYDAPGVRSATRAKVLRHDDQGHVCRWLAVARNSALRTHES